MAIGLQNTVFIDTFRKFFQDFHGARLKTLVLIVQAMAAVGSINLVKVAAGMKTEVSHSSNYRRIQHFIHEIRLKPEFLIPFLLKLAGIEAPYTLILDRTNWEFGKAKINFLMLSVYGNGWSIPILWSLLPKKGNSNEQERIELLDRFFAIVGKGKIYNLLADREFIGDKWIRYLIDHEIPFDIRVRENMIVLYKGIRMRVTRLFKGIPIGKPTTIRGMVVLGTNKVYLQGERIVNTKTKKIEWLIVSTYHQPGESIKRYGQRWYIENMFKDMKSNGFQLKCTHITDPERLSTLMSILAIAYTWMIRIGTWVKKIKPEIFKKKKHGRPAKSIFRAGLEEFANAIYTLSLVRLKMYFNFLSCT